MKIKAIVFDKPNSVQLGEAELKQCGEEDVIAETIYSFVSPGTELRVLCGQQPNAKYPLIPGYSWVGRIIEVGAKVKGWECGDLVSGRNPYPAEGMGSCWGGQASHHRCDTTGMIVKLPHGADPWQYVHAEVASISYRGVCAANPQPNETAVVIGQGMIGLFNTKWLLLRGARVIVTDIEDFRLAPAKKWGVAAALNGNDPNIREKILSYCTGGADIVIESSSNLEAAKLAGSLIRKPIPQALATSYQRCVSSCASTWPRLVFQATYHNKTIEMKPPGLLTGIEGALVIQPFDRSVADRMEVVEHIRNGNLPITDLLDAPTALKDAPAAYIDLQQNPGKVRGLAIKW